MTSYGAKQVIRMSSEWFSVVSPNVYLQLYSQGRSHQTPFYNFCHDRDRQANTSACPGDSGYICLIIYLIANYLPLYIYNNIQETGNKSSF